MSDKLSSTLCSTCRSKMSAYNDACEYLFASLRQRMFLEYWYWSRRERERKSLRAKFSASFCVLLFHPSRFFSFLPFGCSLALFVIWRVFKGSTRWSWESPAFPVSFRARTALCTGVNPLESVFIDRLRRIAPSEKERDTQMSHASKERAEYEQIARKRLQYQLIFPNTALYSGFYKSYANKKRNRALIRNFIFTQRLKLLYFVWARSSE